MRNIPMELLAQFGALFGKGRSRTAPMEPIQKWPRSNLDFYEKDHNNLPLLPHRPSTGLRTPAGPRFRTWV